MQFEFSKYQDTGNDFVVIDGRSNSFPVTEKDLTRVCHRRFGIGADGVIIILDHTEYDFEVIYYNPDGSQSFCGNGTRSAVHFANSLGLIQSTHTRFIAFDGPHEASLLGDDQIRLKMGDVQNVRLIDDGTFVDTGSPHLVRFVENVSTEDVISIGRKLRYGAPIEGGTNVNFVQQIDENSLEIRTYERGVENETYSCGTGVTASAIAASFDSVKSPVTISTKGGKLVVEFETDSEKNFREVYLTGPAECVYQGTYEIENS